MVKQKVPDIDFKWFALGDIPDLFTQNKVKINSEYQRSYMWKQSQKIELIRSIQNSYSIGVLVLFINSEDQHEILDGQQRLLAIKEYIEGKLDLTNSGVIKYSDLTPTDKRLLDAYCIYYLKLKGFEEETQEEDITQTFIRLQEGTPLNKAEKINAYRGKFKDTFRKLRQEHNFFQLLCKDKRFRWRLLAAEFLLLELESDFENKIFPDLSLPKFKEALEKYKENISDKKIKFLTGNLDFLQTSLNIMLSALQPRELVSFYVLISYLRRDKADNSNLMNEFENFAEDFLKNLNSFSIYDSQAPAGMADGLFKEYRKYKEEARKATTADSITARFEFLLKEFKRMCPYIEKDKDRLHDTEQKRTLYFRQKGICPECSKKFRFEEGTSHHIVAHSKGGKTDDLEKANLLHKKCHEKLEKKIENAKNNN